MIFLGKPKGNIRDSMENQWKPRLNLNEILANDKWFLGDGGVVTQGSVRILENSVEIK